MLQISFNWKVFLVFTSCRFNTETELLTWTCLMLCGREVDVYWGEGEWGMVKNEISLWQRWHWNTWNTSEWTELELSGSTVFQTTLSCLLSCQNESFWICRFLFHYTGCKSGYLCQGDGKFKFTKNFVYLLDCYISVNLITARNSISWKCPLLLNKWKLRKGALWELTKELSVFLFTE